MVLQSILLSARESYVLSFDLQNGAGGGGGGGGGAKDQHDLSYLCKFCSWEPGPL